MIPETSGQPRTVREMLIYAMMELMAEKPFMDITVTDLVAKAGVARVSFYRNFGSIDDVVDAAVAGMAQNFVDEVLPVLTCRDERRWREFLFAFFYEAARNSKTAPIPNEQNRAMLSSRLGALMSRAERAAAASPGSLGERFGPSAKMALLMDVNSRWIMGGMQETPEELVDWVMSFITTF